MLPTQPENRSPAGKCPWKFPPRQSQKVKTLDLKGLIDKVGASNVLTWLKLTVGGKTVSENLVLFTAPERDQVGRSAIQMHCDHGRERHGRDADRRQPRSLDLAGIG